MKRYEGTIITCDSNDRVAKHLVENRGRIVYIGDELPERYQGCDRVLIGEGALVPAFVDTHQHFASFATFHAGLNVMEAESNEEIMELLTDFVRKSRAKTLIAFGASAYSVKEKCLIKREALDRVCSDRPLMLVKYDGHACIINSALLEKLRPRLSKLRGFHPDTGEMNQEAFFAVSDFITGSLSLPELVRNMQRAFDYQASKGIGMVHTVSGVGFPMNMDISLEKWIGKSVTSGFQLRVFPQSMNTKVATSRKLPRIGGCFECALDGCFGSADATLLSPYQGTDDTGILYYTDEKVISFCKEANRLGLQIEMHAIGDAAFDQATRALKAALDDYPREDHRHGIIHACLPTEAGLEICGEYGIQLPIQSAFINWKQEPDDYLEALLGRERASMLNPLRTMWDKGLILSAGSDAPCTDPDPIQWIHRACNHSTGEQSLTVQEALRMCTANGAYVTFDERDRGSLEEGKIADMVILSDNPYTVETARLNTIRVRETILSGEPYRPQSQGFISAVVKGMLQ